MDGMLQKPEKLCSTKNVADFIPSKKTPFREAEVHKEVNLLLWFLAFTPRSSTFSLFYPLLTFWHTKAALIHKIKVCAQDKHTGGLRKVPLV